MTQPAILALEDGTVFEGVSVGAPGLSVGEVVFNTAMTGYQEILTDPSYARQLVTLTYPHIGNTGCTDQDDEARAGVGRRPDRARRAAPPQQLAQPARAARMAAAARRGRHRRHRHPQAHAPAARPRRAERRADGRRPRSMSTQALEAARKFPGLKGMDLAKEVSDARTAIAWTRRPARPRRNAFVAYAVEVPRGRLRLRREAATSCACWPNAAAK